MSRTPRIEIKDMTVCVVGLGYVGFPLAEAFAQNLETIGQVPGPLRPGA